MVKLILELVVIKIFFGVFFLVGERMYVFFLIILFVIFFVEGNIGRFWWFNIRIVGVLVVFIVIF